MSLQHLHQLLTLRQPPSLSCDHLPSSVITFPPSTTSHHISPPPIIVHDVPPPLIFRLPPPFTASHYLPSAPETPKPFHLPCLPTLITSTTFNYLPTRTFTLSPHRIIFQHLHIPYRLPTPITTQHRPASPSTFHHQSRLPTISKG